MNLRSLIEEYLKKAKLMQIATDKKNKPWIASVWYAHDEQLHLYFLSRKNRRHSFELKENPHIAGAIVIPHTKGSGETVRGLQFEGVARETNKTELTKAKNLYEKKHEQAERLDLTELLKPDIQYTYYIIEPKLFVLFDELNFPENPRQEYNLSDA